MYMGIGTFPDEESALMLVCHITGTQWVVKRYRSINLLDCVYTSKVV